MASAWYRIGRVQHGPGLSSIRPLRIAVAGCGPAGLAAALTLARNGHAVELFDRFESPRPVGSGLMIQPTGLAVLEALGLGAALLARGARIDRLEGVAADSGRTVLDVRYASLRRPAFGIGVHRSALFDLLYEAVRAAPIRIVPGRTVHRSEFMHGKRQLFIEPGSCGGYDLVVDALGARSPLANPGRPLRYGALWATVPWPEQGAFDAAALQQRYRRASVMAGVLPVGRPAGADRACAAFFWSLRADRLDAWQARGLDAWKAEVRALWPETEPLLDAISDPAQLSFARYAHRTLGEPAELGLVHIGDSWHATSPQLGQGANMALLDAWALAAALRSADSLDAALAAMVRWRRRHVGIYQAMSRIFTPVYQSDGRVLPFVRDWVVGPLSKLAPVNRLQAAMVSGLVGDPLRPLGLA